MMWVVIHLCVGVAWSGRGAVSVVGSTVLEGSRGKEVGVLDGGRGEGAKKNAAPPPLRTNSGKALTCTEDYAEKKHHSNIERLLPTF